MNFTLKKDKLVYYLLIPTIIVDGINGLIINQLHLNNSIVGISYRAIIIIYFLLVLIKSNFKNVIKILFILIYFILNIIFSYSLNNNGMKEVYFDSIESSKLILSMIIASGLITYLKHNQLDREVLKKFIYDSVKILCVIYLISCLIGIGKNTYGTIGYKSIFNASNGLNVVLIIFFIFQAEKINQTKKKVDVFFAILVIIIMILLGSKSSFIFLIVYFLFKCRFKNNIFKSTLYLIACVILVAAMLICIWCIFKNEIYTIIQRQMYFYNKYQQSDKSILTFLLSQRNVFLQASWQYFYKNLSLINIFLGTGSYNNKLNTASIIGIYSFKSIEMDFFDIFFSYGIIGIIITYGFAIKIYLKNRKILIKSRKYPEIISFVCVMIFSITGGHVFTDAMASTYLGVILALLYNKK